MKVTAITRFKHGEIHARLKRLGWTQSDLAKKSGLTITTTNNVINLIRRPTIEQATAIQRAFGEAGEYFDVLAEWPETFAGIERGYKLEQTAEVEMENLLSCREAMMLPSPQNDSDTTAVDDALEANISELTKREAAIIRMRFWHNKTLAEIANKINLGRERVRQIEANALRKLRNPHRIQKLSKHLTYAQKS